MRKKMYIDYEAFRDEFEKIARASDAQLAMMLAAPAVFPFAAAYMSLPKKTKENIKEELRDPRLYSNIRGVLSLEDQNQRKKAHKGLAKSDGTILGAMKSGLLREKTAVDVHSLSSLIDPHSLHYLQVHGGDIADGVKKAVKLYRKATPAGLGVTVNYVKGRAGEIADSAKNMFRRAAG